MATLVDALAECLEALAEGADLEECLSRHGKHRDELDSLLENLAPYGVAEMTRTGRIAMLRGEETTAVHEPEPVELQRFHQESGRRPEGELPYVSD